MRVVIVVRHEVVREGLTRLAERLDCVEEITATSTLDGAAVRLGDRWPPDVVLIDGAELQGHEEEARSARVVVLVTGVHPDALAATARCDADGYVVLPSLDQAALGDALQRVVAGQLVLPTELAQFLLRREATRQSAVAHPPLTPREVETLTFMVQGLSNKQIALRLRISIHGVKRHVSNVLNRMACPNRAQAVAKALQAGIVPIARDDESLAHPDQLVS